MNTYMNLRIGDTVKLEYQGTSANGGMVTCRDTVLGVRPHMIAVHKYHARAVETGQISRETYESEWLWINRAGGYRITKVDDYRTP
jgi:hypothetical protein